MTIYLSTQDPGGEREVSDAEPVFLIRGPVIDGKVRYFLTRAVDRYSVPDNPPAGQTIDQYFDSIAPAGTYDAAIVPQANLPFGVTAHGQDK